MPLLFLIAAAAVAGQEPKKAPRIVLWRDEGIDWQRIMRNLRAGGAFDDTDRPEGLAFARVKRLRSAAYPHLIGYIDNEDPLLGRAAVAVLNELTGRQSPLPNDGTKGTIKAKWEAWYKLEYPGDEGHPLLSGISGEAVSVHALLPLLLCDHEADRVRDLIDQLSHESVEVRTKADSELRDCIGRHGDLLRAALKKENRGEGKIRLMNILVHAEILEAAVKKVRAEPAILRKFLQTLARTPDRHKDLRMQLEAALDRISTDRQ